MKRTRRDVLKLLGVAAATSMLPSGIKAGNTTTMLQRSIPSTSEKLPVIGLGSWIQFDVGDSTEDQKLLLEVLTQMKELGGKVIDSSPMYGRSEKVIGDLTTQLAISDHFFYATKVWTTGEQSGITQMESSMAKMQRKKLDLIEVHNLQDWKTHLRTLNAWKELGKIRYTGLTHYTSSAHDQLERIIKTEKVDFIQFNYSIRDRNAEKSILNTAAKQGVAVIVNEPFDSGSLFSVVKGKKLPSWAVDYDITSWAQYFLKYIIAHPAVTCVIPGTSDPLHLIDNMNAGFGNLPDEKGKLKMISYLEGL